MKEYYHGVRVQEQGSMAAAPVMGTSGLQVVIGTAPVNLVENPEMAVNVPVVCMNMREAQEKLGYSADFESYTLCQSMYMSFQAFAVAPVVYINVLDPAKHKKENAEKTYAVADGQIILDEDGILRSSVTVNSDDGALAADTDYILSFTDAGKLAVTMVSEKAQGLSAVKVVSASLDPSAVTDADMIGGYDAETGKETGLEVIRQVYPNTGMTPGLILAPGWSHKPEIAAVMVTKCEGINGVFTAECALDMDTTLAKKYTDVEKVKEESGYADPHAIVLWPKVQAGDHNIYYSAAYGAMAAYYDAQNDNVPSLSPSNRLIYVTGAVLEDGAGVYLDRQQASALNGVGVVTLVNESGWRSWGNNTSAYPAVTEEKDRWICCRRMFTWLANTLIVTYHEKVDSPADYRLIESICDAENIRLNSYVAAGKLAGGRIEYDENENSVDKVLAGQVTFRIKVAAFTPAEDILFILQFDPAMLEESLTGIGGME